MKLRIENIDSNEALLNDYKLIREKFILNQIYRDFYSHFKKTKFPKGSIVEIGSGAGFIKEIMPKVITSDVIKGPGIDKVFFAEKMPFKKNSVAGFLMIDVLHHIKTPEKAFKEMRRCLKKGGKIVMIEPYNSPLAGLIYKYIHYEHFDPSAGWKIKGKGRMSNSNTALPWIIFVRDKEKFQKLFPDLNIVKIYPHTPIRYFLSGGLSKFQFLPNFLYPLLNKFENLLSFTFRYSGMFVTIEIEKI